MPSLPIILMMICTIVLANMITADMGFLPGLAFIGPAFGLPLSVLAAVLERPFYSRAGISEYAIWYSLQANLVSLLVGYAALPVVFGLFDRMGLFWAPVPIFISIVVERKYLMWRAGGFGFDGKWKNVVAANIFSALVLMGVLILSAPFNTPQIKAALLPLKTMLTLVAIGLSAAAFIAAFVVPPKRGRASKGLAINVRP